MCEGEGEGGRKRGRERTQRDGLADVLHLTFLSLTLRIAQRALKARLFRRMAFVINAETVRFMPGYRASRECCY